MTTPVFPAAFVADIVTAMVITTPRVQRRPGASPDPVVLPRARAPGSRAGRSGGRGPPMAGRLHPAELPRGQTK